MAFSANLGEIQRSMGYLAARLGKDQPTKAERDALIETARAEVLRRCRPRAIYVFGSILEETFTRASDIDIAVVFRTAADRDRARKALFAAPPLVAAPYDLLLYDESSFERKADQGGICQVIRETGKKIYDEGSKV
jgi:predicted nucleotidyltransferase